MNLTPVEFHFVAPNGDPIMDADVEIQLSKAGFDDEVDGVIMPRGLVVRTDTDGRVTVSLQPSPIHYVVTVMDPETEAGLFYKFYVPVLDEGVELIRLQDIIVDAPMSGATYDEAALVLINATKANVLAARDTAVAAKVASVNARVIAEGARDTALRTLQVNSLTPPVNPIAGMEWYNPETGRKYTWIVQDNGHSTWAEIGALLVISTPAAGEEPPFNPADLDEVHTLSLASTSLLLEQDGEGLRIPLADAGITATQLPAGIPTQTSVIVFTQGGVDKQCTVAQLASVIDQIIRGLI